MSGERLHDPHASGSEGKRCGMLEEAIYALVVQQQAGEIQPMSKNLKHRSKLRHIIVYLYLPLLMSPCLASLHPSIHITNSVKCL